MIEEKLQKEYAMILGLVEKARGEQKGILDEISRRGDQVRRAVLSGISYKERSLWEDWIQSRRGEAQRVEQSIAALHDEVERRRKRWTHAAQQTKVMEELEKQELEARRRKEELEERKQFDEIAARNHIRAQREKAADQPERIAR